MTIFTVREEHCVVQFRSVRVNAARHATHVSRPHNREVMIYAMSRELLDWMREHAGIEGQGWHYRDSSRKIKIVDPDVAFAFKLRWC